MQCESCRKKIKLSEKVDLLCQQWEDVLKHHGCERKIFNWEVPQIGRAVQQWGPEAVNLAFLGSKYEQGRDGFDPSQYLSLNRVLESTKIQRFISIGAKARAKILAKRSKNGNRKPTDGRETNK